MKGTWLGAGLVVALILGLGIFSNLWAMSCPRICGEAKAAMEAVEKEAARVEGTKRGKVMTLISDAKDVRESGWSAHEKAPGAYEHAGAMAKCWSAKAYADAAVAYIKVD